MGAFYVNNNEQLKFQDRNRNNFHENKGDKGEHRYNQSPHVVVVEPVPASFNRIQKNLSTTLGTVIPFLFRRK
jgi:hypothetical protein